MEKEEPSVKVKFKLSALNSGVLDGGGSGVVVEEACTRFFSSSTNLSSSSHEDIAKSAQES